MSWSELCDHVMLKIGKNLKPKEVNEFRKWFMLREQIGYRFEPALILRCFKIWQDLKNHLDHFIVISGREGYGKSTLALQLACWVTPNFTLKNICYGAKSYITQLSEKADKYETNNEPVLETLIMDEGIELLSRESLNLTNRALLKTFFIQRTLNYLVIVCCPNYFMLDSVLRLHRVRTVIHLVQRAGYKVITGRGIQMINKIGAKSKDINSVRLPEGFFWHGTFSKPFPKTIDVAEYDAMKMKGVREVLTTLKEGLSERKMIKTTEVAKGLGCNRELPVDWIKEKRIVGKKIGGVWYMPIEEYEKLMNRPDHLFPPRPKKGIIV